MKGELVGGQVRCIWAGAPGEKGIEETSRRSNKTEALSQDEGCG